MQLRGYQIENTQKVLNFFNQGKRRVLLQQPTGTGKTPVIAEVTQQVGKPTLCMAHRTELIGQMSVALAPVGMAHNLIVPKDTVKRIVAKHIDLFGRSYFQPNARNYVGSIGTLAAAKPYQLNWLPSIGLWIVDEAHHSTANQYNDFLERMPTALGFGLTATPDRADGKGLGVSSLGGSGLFEEMVSSPSPRWFIDNAYLCDYRVICPKSDIEVDDSMISGTTGDYNQVKLRDVVHKAKNFVGDIVKTYQQWCPGKLSVVFTVDIEEASKIAAEFRAQGIPAQPISSKTDPAVRAKLLEDFAARRILVLVNVDLFGEGFDLPALEVVQMARPTASLPLYLQQVGRMLRLDVSDILMGAWDTFTVEQRLRHIAESRKPWGLLIDHVGNFARHQKPCMSRPWSLRNKDKRARTSPDDATKLTTCLNIACLQPYPAIEVVCPYCHEEQPVGVGTPRTKPAMVDGDMVLLDPKSMSEINAEIQRVMSPTINTYGLPPVAVGSARKRHKERFEAIVKLKDMIAWYAGYYREHGEPDRVTHKRFYADYKIDIMTAQTLGREEAEELTMKLFMKLMDLGVTLT